VRVQNARLKISGDYAREYHHEYLIITNDEDSLMGEVLSQAAVFAAGGNDPFPSLWDSYNVKGETDAGSFLQEIDCGRFKDEDDDKLHWLAKCTWKKPSNGNGADAVPAADPTADPIRWHAEFSQFTRKITRDVDDNRLIANSAGDLFDDVEIDDGRVIIVAERNYLATSFGTLITQMKNYSNSVNDANYLGQDVATLKMDSIAMSDLKSREGIDYYTVTYRIQLCTEAEVTWHLVLENKGSMAYDRPKTDPDAVKSRVVVLEGVKKGEFRDFAYLAYDGTQLIDVASPNPIPAVSDEPFHRYKEKDWSVLGLA
jgi:hypothetical protein